MKILICGDSFAADWSIKYPERLGWCNWLSENHSVTNIAQAGAGEYKLLKQIQATDLNKFDAVIVSHASPNRLYCTAHPVHNNDVLHHNADLIYADIKDHAATNADAHHSFPSKNLLPSGSLLQGSRSINHHVSSLPILYLLKLLLG